MIFFQRLFPKRVKTKLLLSLGILIAVMVIIPVILVYRDTISTTIEQAQTSLQEGVKQINDKLISETTDQLSLPAKTVASQGTGQVKGKANELKQYAEDLRTLIEKFNIS